MTQIDQRFEEIVIESSSMLGPDGRSHKSCCSACGTYHRVSVNEFKRPFLVSAETLRFTSEMRAWNCCHEGQEPLDGFPAKPDNSRYKYE